MQEEQPSASMFRGFHQLTYLPHYLAPSPFFDWALPTLFSRMLSRLHPRASFRALPLFSGHSFGVFR